MARLLQEELEAKGFDIQYAPDAEKATSIILKRQTRPDLILLDINMPKVDGAQFCRFVKKNEMFRSNQGPLLLRGGSGPRRAAGRRVWRGRLHLEGRAAGAVDRGQHELTNRGRRASGFRPRASGEAPLVRLPSILKSHPGVPSPSAQPRFAGSSGPSGSSFTTGPSHTGAPPPRPKVAAVASLESSRSSSGGRSSARPPSSAAAPQVRRTVEAGTRYRSSHAPPVSSATPPGGTSPSEMAHEVTPPAEVRLPSRHPKSSSAPSPAFQSSTYSPPACGVAARARTSVRMGRGGGPGTPPVVKRKTEGRRRPSASSTGPPPTERSWLESTSA
ncbi:MAG: response regulator [Anaeromyxobacter sp.]